jgi:hypothetical protein
MAKPLVHIPSPKQIKKRAAQVRRKWSEAEEQKRRAVQPSPARVFRLSLGRSARGTHVEIKD